MESMALLELMDQVMKRVRVTHQEAKEALERNEYNVVEAILELEASPGRASELSRKTVDLVMDPTVTLRRRGRDLIKVPVIAAAGVALLGLVKPKLLVLSLGALLVSGTDIALTYDGNKEVSLHQSFKNRSGKAAANVADMKDKLDDRFHDMKERGIYKENREPGLSYFTIKL